MSKGIKILISLEYTEIFKIKESLKTKQKMDKRHEFTFTKTKNGP